MEQINRLDRARHYGTVSRNTHPLEADFVSIMDTTRRHRGPCPLTDCPSACSRSVGLSPTKPPPPVTTVFPCGLASRAKPRPTPQCRLGWGPPCAPPPPTQNPDPA